ncbi:MAG: rRNA methylase [Acidithiobacillales bacterium SG8_45]|nr:MAG: rRNA methylase [Acidithiobacillales bacterium SG8_45]
MFHIVLFQPEIPPNTGNIIRLCANTGCHLHLVEPLGFSMTDKQLRRAGLDYHEFADVELHQDLPSCLKEIGAQHVYAFSTKGKTAYTDISYRKNDVLVFGPETRGLPEEVLANMPPDHVLRIPMASSSRSLNLSNAAAVAVYEGLRQLGFPQAN